jgi:hypothetical protein
MKFEVIIVSTGFDAIYLAVREYIVSGQEDIESIMSMSDEELSTIVGEEVSGDLRLLINDFVRRIQRRYDREAPLRFLRRQLFGSNRVAFQAAYPNAEFVWCGNHLRIYPEGTSDE